MSRGWDRDASGHARGSGTPKELHGRRSAKDLTAVRQRHCYILVHECVDKNQTRPLKRNQSFLRAVKLVLTFYSSSRTCKNAGSKCRAEPEQKARRRKIPVRRRKKTTQQSHNAFLSHPSLFYLSRVPESTFALNLIFCIYLVGFVQKRIEKR